MKWEKVRIRLLALTFGLGILVLGRAIILSSVEKPKVNASIFPEKIPLAQWQISETHSQETTKDKHPELISEKFYRYIDNGLTLDIEMRYFNNLHNADINSLIRDFYAKKPFTVMRQQEGIGYYGLGVDKQSAFLSACINPRGGSTFTHAQFRNNRYRQDVRLDRLLPALQGQEPLIDKRCLWAHLSIPLNNSSPEIAYKILEKAWFYWYQWWQPRFPKR